MNKATRTFQNPLALKTKEKKEKAAIQQKRDAFQNRAKAFGKTVVGGSSLGSNGKIKISPDPLGRAGVSTKLKPTAAQKSKYLQDMKVKALKKAGSSVSNRLKNKMLSGSSFGDTTKCSDSKVKMTRTDSSSQPKLVSNCSENPLDSSKVKIMPKQISETAFKAKSSDEKERLTEGMERISLQDPNPVVNTDTSIMKNFGSLSTSSSTTNEKHKTAATMGKANLSNITPKLVAEPPRAAPRQALIHSTVKRKKRRIQITFDSCLYASVSMAMCTLVGKSETSSSVQLVGNDGWSVAQEFIPVRTRRVKSIVRQFDSKAHG